MGLMQEHQGAVQRVAEVPGFGPDSAMQMIAEVGLRGCITYVGYYRADPGPARRPALAAEESVWKAR